MTISDILNNLLHELQKGLHAILQMFRFCSLFSVIYKSEHYVYKFFFAQLSLKIYSCSPCAKHKNVASWAIRQGFRSGCSVIMWSRPLAPLFLRISAILSPWQAARPNVCSMSISLAPKKPIEPAFIKPWLRTKSPLCVLCVDYMAFPRGIDEMLPAWHQQALWQ